MKNFIYLLFILCSCSSDAASDKDVSLQTEQIDSTVSGAAAVIDSLISYESLDYDTNKTELKKEMNEQTFHFFFYEYSLNDSGVFQDKKQFNKNNELIFKNINYFHNREIHFYVLKNQRPFFDEIIDKNLFKSVLEEWEFNRIKLFDIKYHHHKNGELFFNTTFMSADTNIVTEVMFTIKDSPQKTKNVIKIINPNDYFQSRNNLEVYDLSTFHFNNNKEIGFISFSDKYQLNEDADSLAIQTKTEYEFEYNSNKHYRDEYIKLDSKHRKRFLNQLKISEKDSLFIYHYGKDTIMSFKIKNLNVVACINSYRQGEQNEPNFEGFDQYDYMIGFEIEPIIIKRLGESYNQNFVCVGKVNPFIKNQLKPVVWTKINRTQFPGMGINTANELLSKRRKIQSDSCYKFTNTNHTYYVKDMFFNDGNYVSSSRRIIVFENKTGEMVLDEFIQEGESTSVSPLNNLNTEEGRNYIYQWTGKLFKYKAPVIFGLNGESFGCPHISFLDFSEQSIYLNCDNRH
ncbi:MAG: hypothetical protein ACOVO9_01050 [Bacteroidia bacterium]